MKKVDRGVVVLNSGGVVSAVVLARAVRMAGNSRVHSLALDYSQLARKELSYASRQAGAHGVSHRVAALGFQDLVKSSAVPGSKDKIRGFPASGLTLLKGRGPTEILGSPDRGLRPAWASPVFLTTAMAYAASLGCGEVHAGFSGSGPWDPWASPGVVAAINRAAKAAEGQGGQRVKVVAPYLGVERPEVIAAGVAFGVGFDSTFSCLSPVLGKPCGECDGCVMRSHWFKVYREARA